jgi:putative membrane protein
MRRQRFLELVAFTGVITTLSACALIEERKAMGDPDSMFLMSTARASAAEEQLSQMAITHAQDPTVRQFAQRVAADHRRMNQELAQVAGQKGLSISEEPDELHQKTAQHLSQLSGNQFDREYMSEMVADHAKMLAKFEDKAKIGQDPHIREWAASKVPAFRQHYKMAQKVNDALTAVQ